jgi:hypothetical protein
MLRLAVVVLLAIALSGCKRPTMYDTEGKPYRPSPEDLREICPF